MQRTAPLLDLIHALGHLMLAALPCALLPSAALLLSACGNAEQTEEGSGFSFAPYAGQVVAYSVTNTERNAAVSVEKSTQSYLVIDGHKAVFIESFERSDISFVPKSGKNKGKEVHNQGRTIRPDLIEVIDKPSHWYQPWKMSLYTKIPVSSVQELSFFQDIVIRVASERIREYADASTHPATLPTNKENLRKFLHLEDVSLTIETETAHETDVRPPSADPKLPHLDLIQVTGTLQYVVTYRGPPEATGGRFEVILDRKTGLLYSLTTILDRGSRRDKQTRTIKLSTITPIADPTSLEASLETYQEFRAHWSAGDMARALELASNVEESSVFHASIQRRVESFQKQAPLLGKPAPTLIISDAIGIGGASPETRASRLIKLMSGRVVLLDFWATWCKPCIASMPHSLDLMQEYPQDSFLVVLPTLENDKNSTSMIQDFAAQGYRLEHEVDFTGIIAVLPSNKEGSSVYRAFCPGAIPRYAVIDTKGIIRFQGTGTTSFTQARRVVVHLLSGQND